MDERNDWDGRIASIDWTRFETAYGIATDVPAQLRRLRSVDEGEVLSATATHDLWCGLCHQHCQLGSAALPALPFLLDVFAACSDRVTVEILDIFLGFAICSNPRRSAEYARAMGREPAKEPWVGEVRSILMTQAPQFISLRNHSDPQIADFSRAIIKELAESGLSIDPAAEPLIPSFAEVTGEFRRFLVNLGWPPTLTWAKSQDVILRRRRGIWTQLVWNGDAISNEALARAEYQRAAIKRVGLMFEARGTASGRAICRVYVPPDAAAAESRLIPKTGVKFSAATNPPPVVLVEGRWHWRILRWLARGTPSPWDY